MFEPLQIEGFDWDRGNSRKSVDKHDVSQAEAEQVFFNDPLLVVEVEGHSDRECPGFTRWAVRTSDDCSTSALRCAVRAG